jgi:voltage-gated potassium channel
MRLAALLTFLIVGGGFVFRILSPESTWVDCVYMAVTTLTTVGYEEVVPLDQLGRVFVMVYLAIGFSVFTYGAFQIGQWIMSAEIQSLFERRRMDKQIQDLRDHYIVCGVGRMGRTICSHLHERGKPVVVIDVDEERLKSRLPGGCLYVHGDATDDQTLRRAGIERARALATVLPTDADNVYVVLSARILSSRLEIIARAGSDAAALKIQRAGANRVVSPYSAGALKIARFMVNPNIEDFLDIADQRGRGDLELADVQIAAGSPYVGRKLADTDLHRLGIIVVGIRRANGQRLMPPPTDTAIEAGDCLFAFGGTAAMNQMIAAASRGA